MVVINTGHSSMEASEENASAEEAGLLELTQAEFGRVLGISLVLTVVFLYYFLNTDPVSFYCVNMDLTSCLLLCCDSGLSMFLSTSHLLFSTCQDNCFYQLCTSNNLKSQTCV